MSEARVAFEEALVGDRAGRARSRPARAERLGRQRHRAQAGPDADRPARGHRLLGRLLRSRQRGHRPQRQGGGCAQRPGATRMPTSCPTRTRIAGRSVRATRPARRPSRSSGMRSRIRPPGSGRSPPIVVEPVQGNGGVVIPPDGFLAGLRELCDRHGTVLIFDEVQCGFGRTGRTWAAEHWGVVPDLMTVGKGIGGGLAALRGRRARRRSWLTGRRARTPRRSWANAVNLAAGLRRHRRPARRAASSERSATVGARLLARLRARARRRPARRRDPRPRAVRRDRDRGRPRRSRRADPDRTAPDPAGRVRTGRAARLGRPPRERHQALPAADHRRGAARHRARADDRHHQRDADDPDRATVIQVANYIDGAWSPAASGRDAREPRPGHRRPGRDRAAVGRRGRRRGRSRRRAPTFDDGAWPATSGRERAAILFELADLLREEAEPLARLVAIEMGKPIRYVREREIAPAIDRILFYASAARMIRGEVTSSAPSHLLNFILKEPVGVCGADHAVERPGRPAAAQDRRRDRDGLHVRAQAGQRRAGVVDGDLRAARPDRGPADAASRTASSGRARSSARRWPPTRGSTRSASPAAARSAAG